MRPTLPCALPALPLPCSVRDPQFERQLLLGCYARQEHAHRVGYGQSHRCQRLGGLRLYTLFHSNMNHFGWRGLGDGPRPDKTGPLDSRGRLSPQGLCSLRQSVHQPRQRLHQIVVDDHYGEEHQENECGLVHAFFDAQAYVAAHQAFDE